MELKLDVKGLEELKNVVSQDMMKKVAGRSLKRTATRFKTVTVKEVRKTYNVKAKVLKDHIKLKKVGNFEYIFTTKSERIGLQRFSPRQTAKGVSVKVRKDSGRKILTGAFLAKGKNGNLRIFERKGKKRLPLKTFYSISIPQMFNKEIVKLGFNEAQKTFEKEFKHNLDYYLRKLK